MHKGKIVRGETQVAHGRGKAAAVEIFYAGLRHLTELLTLVN
jgi:hypothetical protein